MWPRPSRSWLQISPPSRPGMCSTSMRATPRRSRAEGGSAMTGPLPPDLIERENLQGLAALEDDYASLGRTLGRRGRSIDKVKDAVKAFAVAVPTWGLGIGGTRFAKFPLPGEPITLH